MEHHKILEQVRLAYWEAKSYADEFACDSGYGAGFGLSLNRMVFLKPNKFWIEYQDSNCWVDRPGGIYNSRPDRGHSCLWTDGISTYRKRFFEGHSTRESNRDIALRKTGVVRYALRILQLLTISPDTKISLLNDPVLLANESLEGLDCFRLLGSVLSPRDTEIWIDTSKYTIRRIRTKSWFDAMHKLGIADDVPSNDSLPFNVDCTYKLVELNPQIDEAKFYPPESFTDT